MGRVITDIVNGMNDCAVVAGVDINLTQNGPFPVFNRFSDITCESDVIIDFSRPALLDDVLCYAKKNKLGAVIATTGYSDAQIEKIKSASAEIPVFFSFNMSLGINLVVELVKKAASVLRGFDIEIVEKHHNQKVDAPSGTAIMLADEINKELGNNMNYIYNRHDVHEKRKENEIGIHSVRGGTIVGEHEVIFAGRDEVLTISHSAGSKEIFAAGAVKAALFLKNKAPGLYNMTDVVKD